MESVDKAAVGDKNGKMGDKKRKNWSMEKLTEF